MLEARCGDLCSLLCFDPSLLCGLHPSCSIFLAPPLGRKPPSVLPRHPQGGLHEVEGAPPREVLQVEREGAQRSRARCRDAGIVEWQHGCGGTGRERSNEGVPGPVGLVAMLARLLAVRPCERLGQLGDERALPKGVCEGEVPDGPERVELAVPNKLVIPFVVHQLLRKVGCRGSRVTMRRLPFDEVCPRSRRGHEAPRSHAAHDVGVVHGHVASGTKFALRQARAMPLKREPRDVLTLAKHLPSPQQIAVEAGRERQVVLEHCHPRA